MVLTTLLLASFLTVLAAAYVVHGERHLVRLADLTPPAPGRWPRVSVIVPALNEADTLEAALGTLLAETYPDLEIVLVNDRSTDGTDRIVDELARRDPRITPVHVRTLPEGWLGKVHALHVGTQRATGEWLLYSDADVHFTPGVIARAIAVAEAEGLDHLPALPRLLAREFFLQSMLASFGTLFMLLTRPHTVGVGRSTAFAGVGAFNLVRRTALARTPGFEWLRMEVGDDMGLGYMVHAAGGRARFFDAAGLLSITWYPSATAMVRGLEKNTYAILSRFSVLRFVVAVPLLLLFAAGPPLLLGLGVIGWVSPAAGVVGGLAVLGQLTAHVVFSVRQGFGPAPGLAAHVAGTIMLVALLRSAWLCLTRGGITWRGTLYPTALLREGQRLKL